MNRHRSALVIAAVLAVGILSATSSSAAEKVTLCHADGQSGTLKFSELTISVNAAYGQAGHFNEDGTPQAGHEDDYLGPCKTTSTTTPTTTPSTTPTTTPSTVPPPSTTVPETTTTTVLVCTDPVGCDPTLIPPTNVNRTPTPVPWTPDYAG